MVVYEGWPICEDCPAGTSSGVSSTTCTPCAFGSYAVSGGSASCAQCPYSSMTTSPLEDTCTCILGFSYTDGLGCVQCPTGSFRSNQMPDHESCAQCPLNSATNAPGFDHCICVNGYVSNWTGLTQEHAGHTSETHEVEDQFKVYNPMENCVPCPFFDCPTNQYQHGVFTCHPCPVESTSVQGSYGVTSCECNPGFGGTDNCEACAIESFKTSTGMHPCTQCTGGAVTAAVGKTIIGDCLCDSGSYFESGTCITCAQNTYKDSISDITYCNNCNARVTYSTGSKSIHSCVCPAGKEEQVTNDPHSPCNACAATSYNPHKNGTCLGCPADSPSAFSGNTECECGPGLYMITDAVGKPSQCLLCPVGTYSSGYGNTCDPSRRQPPQTRVSLLFLSAYATVGGLEHPQMVIH